MAAGQGRVWRVWCGVLGQLTASQRAAVAESRVRGLEEDLDLARTQNADELSRLRDQVGPLWQQSTPQRADCAPRRSRN